MAIPDRKNRPSEEPPLRVAPGKGDIFRRRPMEASENTGPSLEGIGGTGLHRVDPDRVATTLAGARQTAGFSRLELMLTAVLPRLVGETRDPKPS